MQDLGRSMKDMMDGPEAVPAQDYKNKKSYPNLCMDSERMDGIDGLAVGDEVIFTFRAKLNSLSVRDSGDGERGHYDFDLLQGAVKPVASSNNKSADDSELPTKAKDTMQSLMEEESDSEDMSEDGEE